MLTWLGGAAYPFSHAAGVRFVISTTSDVPVLRRWTGQHELIPNVQLVAASEGQHSDLCAFDASVVRAYFDCCGAVDPPAAIDVDALAAQLAERSRGSFFWLRLVEGVLNLDAPNAAAGKEVPLSIAEISGMFPRDEGPMLRYYIVHAVESAFEHDGERALETCLRALRFAALLPDWIDAESLRRLLEDGTSASRANAKHAVGIALRTLIESRVDDARVRQQRRVANGV